MGDVIHINGTDTEIPCTFDCRPVRLEERWYIHTSTAPGETPAQHPSVRRSPRDNVIIESKQVWVENDTDELWVIEDCRNIYTQPGRPHVVTLVPLNGDVHRRQSIDERQLRDEFLVWNDAVNLKIAIAVAIASQ